MPIKSQIVAGLIAFAVSQDLTNRLVRRRNRDMVQIIAKLLDHSQSLESQMEYLVHLLNENEITLDEFDLIVLPGITQKS